jgi:hypothetical protein
MNKPPSMDNNPPRWLQCLLLLILKRRDRQTVSGDLLEEYREVVFPERGALRGNLWYFKQTLSLVDQVRFGTALGIALGLSNLLATMIAPLWEDTPLGVFSCLVAVMFLWALIGFAAERQTARVRDAARAGAVVGAISLGLFHIAVMLRVNIFLDVISRRSDWQGLMLKFQHSGFESLRAYANWDYLQLTGPILFFGVLAGGLCGTLGGLLAAVVKRNSTRELHT